MYILHDLPLREFKKIGQCNINVGIKLLLRTTAYQLKSRLCLSLGESNIGSIVAAKTTAIKYSPRTL